MNDNERAHPDSIREPLRLTQVDGASNGAAGAVLNRRLSSAEFQRDFDLGLSPPDPGRIAAATREILAAAGEDPARPGLRGTPQRVARAWEELLGGYRVDPVQLVNGALFPVEYDDMVVVRNIEFFSLCEHHLLPFHGRAHVAYMPAGRVIGLSKIPRIVDMFARRLQLQERMTRQIVDFLTSALEPRGVGVVLEGLHFCAMMRGVKKHEAAMTTSAMRGLFREDAGLRAEFLADLQRPVIA